VLAALLQVHVVFQAKDWVGVFDRSQQRLSLDFVENHKSIFLVKEKPRSNGVFLSEKDSLIS